MNKNWFEDDAMIVLSRFLMWFLVFWECIWNENWFEKELISQLLRENSWSKGEKDGYYKIRKCGQTLVRLDIVVVLLLVYNRERYVTRKSHNMMS